MGHAIIPFAVRLQPKQSIRSHLKQLREEVRIFSRFLRKRDYLSGGYYHPLFLFEKVPFFPLRRCCTISDYMINEQIRDKEIRLIGEHGEQLGVMPAKDALHIAQEANLDLVKIAPNAEPPVCRIVDYSKFRYEQVRKAKENRKKQKTTEIKEIQLTPGIADNDLNTKAGQARKFITKGNKVKVELRFRGREMAHQQAGMDTVLAFCQKLEDVAAVDKPPKMEGRNLVVILAEKK
jgi:translation initiation factor IF-3